MKNPNVVRLIVGIYFGFWIWMLGFPALAGVGTTGANFLLLGGGARPLAMGEAYVALADDSSSIFWNPAGTSRMNFPEIMYMYSEWFINIKHQYFDAAFPSDYGTFGGSYSLLDSGDIQGYDSYGSPEAVFKTQSSALTFSWGRKLNDKFSVGANLKSISESLEDSQASSLALDLGLLFEANPRLSFGAAIQNFGQPLKFDVEETPLPQTYRLGMGFKSRLYGEDLNLAADYVNPAGGASSINLGVEYLLQNFLALRMGTAKGRFTAGVGLKVANFDLDYAYLSHDVLGSTNQISFSYNFGTEEKKQALILDHLALAKEYYNAERFAEAIVELEKVLKLDPEHAEGRALIKKAENALEKKAKGVVVEEIKTEKEEEAGKYIEAGKKFMAEKQYLEAIAEFNKALKILPSHPEAVKLIREAQEALEKEVTEKVKKEAEEHLGLALKHITTGDYAEAMREVEEVLKIDPGNVQALKLYKKLKKIIELEKKEEAR